MNYLVSLTLLGGVCVAAGGATAGEPLQLSEIRSKGDGPEFVELTGTPGTVLDGLTFVAIGDDDPNFPDPPSDVGNIESIVALDGGIIPDSGVFFISDDEVIDPDLLAEFGPFGLENGGQNTYLLVEGFTGTDLQDLDTDNDGRLDVTPWTGVVDAVGLVAEGDTGFPYGAWLGFVDVGPDGDFTPAHIFRCGLGGDWLIGDFGSSDDDSPGVVNPCPSVELSVSKTGPGTAISGNEIVFTLTLDNGGIDAAADVSIVDVLPAGMTFVSETSPPEVELVDGVGPELEWLIASLPGQSFDIVIEVVVLLAEEAAGPLTNSVSVSTSSAGDDPADNMDETTTVASPIVDPPSGLSINEIRVDQDGDDLDEYLELSGEAGTSLDGLTYLVIGDGGAAGSGVLEAVVPLSGQSIGFSGLFLAAEETFTLIPAFLVDLVTDLNFENGDNVTHLLVANFSGDLGDDLDTDDDGVLDVTPWSDLLDAVGLVESADDPPSGTEYAYGVSLGFQDVGPSFQPNGVFAPSQVNRCTPEGFWRIGTFDVADPAASDTPATANLECPGVMLTVLKSGPDAAGVGGMVTYTLSVINSGFDPAEDVTITDTLPDGLSFVSESSPDEVTLDDSTEPDIVWSVASVGAKQIIQIELVALVGKSAGDEIVNTVAVTTSSAEDDPEDNMDTALTTIVGPPPVIVISETRLDQPGGDDDEYFELRGEAGVSLDGLTYLSIGDAAPALGSGVIESVTSLTGVSMPASGWLVVAEDTFTLGLADLVANLNFENNDNVTHLVVSGFSGQNGQDLDTDDDGTLDVMPWSSVVDAIGIVLEPNPPVDTEFTYGQSLGFEDIGPDQCVFRPAHIYRCTPDDAWTIGVFDLDADDDGVIDADLPDSPGMANPECPAESTCPADTDGNSVIDVDDLVAVILAWGGDGADTNTDINGDCVVNVDDLVGVILGWGPCP